MNLLEILSEDERRGKILSAQKAIEIVVNSAEINSDESDKEVALTLINNLDVDTDKYQNNDGEIDIVGLQRFVTHNPDFDWGDPANYNDNYDDMIQDLEGDEE